MSVTRILRCWNINCRHENKITFCRSAYFDCLTTGHKRDAWYKSTLVFQKCDARIGGFNYGMFAIALHEDVAKANFFERYFYCLWFGLKSLRLVCFIYLLDYISHLKRVIFLV